jgi:hypothetical protein
VVLLAEGDLIVESPTGAPHTSGYASMLQADVELIQGVHLIPTAEVSNLGGPGSVTQYGGWLGAAWFFAPHADVRVDFNRTASTGAGSVAINSYMAQLHVFL